MDEPLWTHDPDAVSPTFGVKGSGTAWTYSCRCGFQTVALVGESAARGVERVHRTVCELARR